jgi:hypothetical protein
VEVQGGETTRRSTRGEEKEKEEVRAKLAGQGQRNGKGRLVLFVRS